MKNQIIRRCRHSALVSNIIVNLIICKINRDINLRKEQIVREHLKKWAVRRIIREARFFLSRKNFY